MTLELAFILVGVAGMLCVLGSLVADVPALERRLGRHRAHLGQILEQLKKAAPGEP